MLKSYKDRYFLVFEFEDGKNVKYNLVTGESIGKSGKVVKDICSQLRGYNLSEVICSFQDENYKRFLNFVYHKINSSNCYTITNIGTFLKKMKRYLKYEQFFSSGLTQVGYINCSFSEVPKGLIKACKTYDILLSNSVIDCYKRNPSLINMMFDMEFNEITKQEVYNLISNSYSVQYLNALIEDYNYKPKSLLKYIDNLMTYEGLQNFRVITRELYDYTRMVSVISNKYEKYPKNFLTTHRIASRNYDRLKTIFNEELFKKRINYDLEFKYQDYIIVYPKTTQDIKDEAMNQNHCVASYIDRVIDGKCDILFLRKKDTPDKSLITLEVRNKQVVQARGKFNRETTLQEKEVLNKYNEKLGGL